MTEEKKHKMPNSYHQARGAEMGSLRHQEALENLGIKPMGDGVMSDSYVLEIDPHALRASRSMGITYPEFMKLLKADDFRAKRERQHAKQVHLWNKMGGSGLGAPKFVDYMGRFHGKKATLKEAEVLFRKFKEGFPDLDGLMGDLKDMMLVPGEQPTEYAPGGMSFRRAWGKTPNLLNLKRAPREKTKVEGKTGVYRVKAFNPWGAIKESTEGLQPGELHVQVGTIKNRAPGKSMSFVGPLGAPRSLKSEEGK